MYTNLRCKEGCSDLSAEANKQVDTDSALTRGFVKSDLMLTSCLDVDKFVDLMLTLDLMGTTGVHVVNRTT
eukprot:6454690-Amphidinium_carterae.1